ncbi:MAG: winged helix-turn-helix domain-containing protein [Pseudoalteromonas prydzensis]|uniref:winged helix-turn-helix domain-containing protein n=1 Tax=Pseudoalteromonas prydzensis TaxID=182141 RepID=UPI003F9C9746
MRYIFDTFEFDSTSLVLKNNGQDLAIRHNDAKVLKLLLEHSDTVFSKEDILSQVWQGKVVSEQAVFQSISNLRGLFGSHAIKTFSKRGYQWQLKVDATHCDTEKAPSTVNSNIVEQPTAALAFPHQRKKWLVMAFTALTLFAIALMYLIAKPSEGVNSAVINIAYIPLSTQSDAKQVNFSDDEHFDFTEIPHLNTAYFQVSADYEYPQLASEYPLILSGTMRTYNQKTYIDFILKGPFSDWRGHVLGADQRDATKQLLNHLQNPVIYNLLNEAQAPAVQQANLTIAHQQAPNDLIILSQLTNSYLRMGEREKAMVMATKLEKAAISQKNTQYVGNALFFQSDILTRKELFDLSTTKLTNAIAQFKKINDLPRQADALVAQSWIDHNQADYNAIKHSLLTSAKLAYEAHDKQRELNAINYLSVLAHKNKQEDDKYLYLTEAESKMKAYQFPSYHLAIIPFHYAIFSKSLEDKEPHFKQVLKLATLTPEFWAAIASRKQLMKYYISQNRLTDAQALMTGITLENADNSYLKTLLADAQNDTDAFITHAERTFEQAQLAGNLSLSLDIALLICGTENPQVNYDFYSQYINEKGSDYWRRINEEKLTSLSL